MLFWILFFFILEEFKGLLYPLVLSGLFAYLLFNAAFLYMIGFLIEFAVPKAINDGAV